MSQQPPRYAKLALGCFERLLASGVSKKAVLTYARLRTNVHKRALPGLIHVGAAGCAESLGLPVGELRRHLRELDSCLLVDQKHSLIYVLGSVEEDPPRVPNSVRAFARQFLELPEGSPVTAEMHRAITATLADERYAKLRQEWEAELGPHLKLKSTGNLRPYLPSKSGQHPVPVPVPKTGTGTEAGTDTGPAALDCVGSKTDEAERGKALEAEADGGTYVPDGKLQEAQQIVERLRLASAKHRPQ